MYPEFAAHLNQALAQNHRSGSWLARQLGIDPSTVARWRNGDSRPKSPEIIIRIADILRIHERIVRQQLMNAAGYAYMETLNVETVRKVNSEVIRQTKESTVASALGPKASALGPKADNRWVEKHREIAVLGLFLLCGLGVLCWRIRGEGNG